MVRLEHFMDEDILIYFRRMYGYKYQEHTDLKWWMVPLFYIAYPILCATGHKAPPHFMRNCGIFTLFTIWLVNQPYAGGVLLLIYPIAIITILSGGLNYPFRMVFDSSRLVTEVIAGKFGVMKHDGNTNTDMATGMSVGFSED